MSQGSRRPRSRSVLVVAVSMALLALGLSACLPPPPGTPTAITTDPALFPAFQAGVSDYVIRCDPNTPTAVHVATPNGTFVSVDGRYPRSGIFGESVSQGIGQRFTIAVTTDAAHDTTTVYNVRCLPSDFPDWSTTHTGSTGAQWYITNPIASFAAVYPMILDTNGVPVWWGPKQPGYFTTLLPDGNLGTVVNGGVEERRLDGSLIRTVKTVSGPVDGHDALLLPNGDFVMVADVDRPGVDLSAIGGPASATLRDHVIEEIAPSDGHVVWSWDVADHIPVTEMDPQWRAQYVVNGPAPYDVYHWNSIEATGSGFVVSFRHLDAVYKIDQASGDIVWKLGGSALPQSLTVNNDPAFSGGSHFGGQHDARLLGDGTVSLFDDGTNLGRPPRVVRYAIDEGAHTATLVESVTDPDVAASACCGSARKLGIGDWAIGWGGTDLGTESVGGARHFSVTFPGTIVYRLIPVPPGQLSRDALRAGMDAQYAPGGAGVTAQEQPAQSVPFPP